MDVEVVFLHRLVFFTFFILTKIRISKIRILKIRTSTIDKFLPYFLEVCNSIWGKMTISNAGISKPVFRKPPGAPGRVRVVDGQVARPG